MSTWDARRLDAGTCYEAKLGLLKIWLKHSYQDWFVAWEHGPFSTRKALLQTYFRPVKSEPTGWRRWVFEAGTHTVKLVPRMPDRSVVVQPDMPLRIPPGQRALFFVTIPLWIGVTVGEGAPVGLCEIPTTILSNTWFGDFSAGELCYALRSRAKRKIDPPERAIHCAFCPVQVTNAATADLEFVHLCIHAEHLGVYQVPGRMWTNRVEVMFQGGEQGNQITTVGGAPDTEGDSTLTSPARRVAQRSLVRKSVQILRNLTGI